MGFIKKELFSKEKKKLFLLLMKELSISQSQAQKLIDTNRVFQNNKPIKDKSASIKGKFEVIIFKPNPKNLRPIFQTDNFAIFDKPSGVIVHPRNRLTKYSMLDEVRALFGEEANITHRIDKETSGLLLVSKTKESEKELKSLFEYKKIEKKYLALVKGKIDKEIIIDEPIKKNRDFSNIRLKVIIDKSGKNAKTFIKPIKYFPKNDVTLIEATPLTGRQHQIRAHLFHVKHPIVGDPIYGVNTEIAIKYLDKELERGERILHTGADRLMLHANYLDFDYKDINYKIYSKYDFLKEVERVLTLDISH
ncbi:RluA family pseudouridine synthase [Nitrosophilus kaiyonis]|uniref:RluA family pseudouridine synthase n=1 Tax=Nitrosophilus kaiyonis TaxID=2930200 RepID=UPI002492D3D1|nr:RluA family pseudouridine synthase [Nitrosophilus kaiyonis]